MRMFFACRIEISKIEFITKNRFDALILLIAKLKSNLWNRQTRLSLKALKFRLRQSFCEIVFITCHHQHQVTVVQALEIPLSSSTQNNNKSSHNKSTKKLTWCHLRTAPQFYCFSPCFTCHNRAEIELSIIYFPTKINFSSFSHPKQAHAKQGIWGFIPIMITHFFQFH